jgi:hypothetical protein
MVNITPSLVHQVERNAVNESLFSYQENICLEKKPLDEYVLDDKKHLLAGGMTLFVLKLVTSAAEVLAGQLSKRLASKTLDAGESRLRRLFNKVPAKEEVRTYEKFYGRKLPDAVELVQKNWHDITGPAAIRYAFGFLYHQNPNHPTLQARDKAMTEISADDVIELMQRHNLTVDQIYHIFLDVDGDYGLGREQIRSKIWDALLQAKRMGKGEQAPQTSTRITTTQKMYLQQMKRQRVILELDGIRDILIKLSDAIKSTPTTSRNAPEEVVIDGYEIALGRQVTVKTVGRFALAKRMADIADKIADDTALAKEDESFLVRLLDKNPALQKKLEDMTHKTEESIKSVNLAMQMLEEAELGENRWFARVLDEVNGIKGSAEIIIIVNEPGGKKTRYEFRLNPSGFGIGERMELYVVGKPHPISPYSFGEVNIVDVTSDGMFVTWSAGVGVKDGHSKTFPITTDEIEHLRSLSRDFRADDTLKNSTEAEAFFRFFNKFQAITKMVFGNGFILEEGSPQASIGKLTETLVKRNWSVALEQGLDTLAVEFNNPSSLAARLGKTVSPEVDLFIEAALDAELGSLGASFTKSFSQANQPEFKKLLAELRTAVVAGSSADVNRAIARIKALASKQIGKKAADLTLSIDLYEEMEAWLRVENGAQLKEYVKGNMPPRLRDVIIARGVDASKPPSLEEARNCAATEPLKALREYDRIVAEPSIPIGIKILAQAEKAALAASPKVLQRQRARRARTWIEWMRVRGEFIPPEADAILTKLPALNGPKSPRPATPAVQETSTETNDAVVFEDTRPKTIQYAEKGAKAMRDIGGGALLGSSVFLGAGGVTKLIFGEPETELEAILQGYDTISIATGAETGISTLREWFPSKHIAPQFRSPAPIAAPLSFLDFAGNIGISALIYRGVYKASDFIEVDKLIGDKIGPYDTNEIVGLIGTGAAFGSAREVLTRVAPDLALDIVRNRASSLLAKEAGGAILYASRLGPSAVYGLKLLKDTTGAALIFDVGSIGIGEAAGLYDSVENASFVSGCKDSFALSFLMPGVYGLECRLLSGSDIDDVSSMLSKRKNREDDSALMTYAANETLKRFAAYLYNVITRDELPQFSDNIIEDLFKDPTLAGKFQVWEAHQHNFLRNESEFSWLFKTDAIDQGKVKNPGAIIFWLEPFLLKTVANLKDVIGENMTTRKMFGWDASNLEKALKTLEAYEQEIKSISARHQMLRPDETWPAQFTTHNPKMIRLESKSK